MTERDMMLSALVAEILGPRDGARETLGVYEEPSEEYITGVLAPLRPEAESLDADEELLGEDDETDSQPSVSPGGAAVAPTSRATVSYNALDRPSSMGLSFVLDCGDPMVDICSTWARYVRTHSGWSRIPHAQVWSNVDCSQEARLSSATDRSFELVIRQTRGNGSWRVSVFIVNRHDGHGPGAFSEACMFQPQIRVRLRGSCRLVPLAETRWSDDSEENSLTLLYGGHPVLGRGHLCSVVWKEIDPERPHDRLQLPTAAPFFWEDGSALLTPSELSYFLSPDIRTEYVPTYAINAPERTWPADVPAPQLDPGILAETWAPDKLAQMLTPLVDGFQAWITKQDAKSTILSPAAQQTAQKHLAGCYGVLSRMRQGLQLLLDDAEVRLAFCFSNKAIALQYLWTKRTVNSWWPFQLAFQILCIPGLSSPAHRDRAICDLLWFPTGGGKTEAYLGLAAFIMALRRLRAHRGEMSGSGRGTAVLSRYTLRLLTIQQFRRALALTTACEYLRVDRQGTLRGWRPLACCDPSDWLWGEERFSIGLWVGSSVTPNNMQDFTFRRQSGEVETVYGALSGLQGKQADGEPAQVLTCPACGATLAIPPDGLRRGEESLLHLVLRVAPGAALQQLPFCDLSNSHFKVLGATLTPHERQGYCTFSVHFIPAIDAGPDHVDEWFEDMVRPATGEVAPLVSVRASRPGYFLRYAPWGRRKTEKAYEFEIFCPNPECGLNADVRWAETTPAGKWPIVDAFALSGDWSSHCPIPAWTVDEQVYHRCPSMVVATADKFARLPYEPRASAMFGNIDRYNEFLGYYRDWCPPFGPSLPPQAGSMISPYGRNVEVGALDPPDLILQDELHLIEGPLGSMFGLYEVAVDALSMSTSPSGHGMAKYVASTATIRQAQEQVASLFARELQVFPAPGISADDSFFARTASAPPIDAAYPGRLYVGVFAPGRGAQTPIRNVWARLLHHAAARLKSTGPTLELDNLWTLVGYFNAVRELAGTVALFRQDIPQRLGDLGFSPRVLQEDEPVELSSRTSSMRLPIVLDDLRRGLMSQQTPVNAVVATSMFGTGVDVDRLGLMIMHGQPKTTSAYIQASGRVGRTLGGLVVVLYRASRPRDLNHYEFFCGYHAGLHRFVEPVTVFPFAARSRDRALGPVAVAVIRQARYLLTQGGVFSVPDTWRVQQRTSNGGWLCHASAMGSHRSAPEVIAVQSLVEHRSQLQPPSRKPGQGETRGHLASELDRWHTLAMQHGSILLYSEPAVAKLPSHPIVLGDLIHIRSLLGVAYEDTPNSLREVEETTTVRGWR